MENNYNQPGNQGNNQQYAQPNPPVKPQKNNNIIKLIILVASIVVLLFVACIFLFFAFIMKMVKSDNAALYGNTSSDKVITRYFQALDDRNRDQMKKCFTDDYNHDLEADLYNADDARDYDWDIDSLSISEDKSLSSTEISIKYNLKVRSAASYSVKCDYTHSVGAEEIPGDFEANLIVGNSSGRFYILDVTEVTFDDESETTESFTEIATEENTEIDTEETTEDASTEETTEEITTTENAVNPDVKTYGSDSLGYLSVPLDLQETDEFGDSFANSSEVKTYKNAEETFVVGLVRYDNSTKSPEDMASELESSLSAQGDTYTTVSDAKIGEYQTIPAKELSFNNADGVYGNFYFFEQDGDLYLIQVVFAFQHVVEAETIVFTYESPK